LSTRLFDTHCHLHDEKLRSSAAEILQRAEQSGVGGATMICADPENLQAFPRFPLEMGQKVSADFKLAYSIGLHPHEARHFNESIAADIRSKAVGANAIGETGLDFHYNFSEAETQHKVFDFQIELACELKKPLIIHCRDAKKEILQMLDRPSIKRHPNPGILHCFTEDQATARALLDLNFYISFSGILTFKNAADLRAVAQTVPANRILIETDSPYLAAAPHRGKNNEPAWVERVFHTLSEIRSESAEDLREILWQNSLRVYGYSSV